MRTLGVKDDEQRAEVLHLRSTGGEICYAGILPSEMVGNLRPELVCFDGSGRGSLRRERHPPAPNLFQPRWAALISKERQLPDGVPAP